MAGSILRHLQAAGTDDAGRRQYLYPERFRAQQEQAEHKHMREVARPAGACLTTMLREHVP
ncbi:hypothetical protein [Streptomyces sp. NPDC050759]|uniref:hypothetical protein n=1 Tax=Streptomyces sp. NPDC050759 TaxID=3365635 RepID=UPI0037AA233C